MMWSIHMRKKSELEYQLYPKNLTCDENLKSIVNCFEKTFDDIDSSKYKYSSNEVLALISDYLESLGYLVEKSKKESDKINVPVLYGRNGKLEKSFNADAYNKETKTVVEVEAGRAVVNYQFLKDLFEASMMSDVEYCVIAVRKNYRNSKDFEIVLQFMDSIYASNKLILPLKGVLIIGY